MGYGFPDDPNMQTAVRRVRRETNRDDLLAASDGGTSATDVGAMIARLRVVARAASDVPKGAISTPGLAYMNCFQGAVHDLVAALDALEDGDLGDT